jgi:hypothetical protein
VSGRDQHVVGPLGDRRPLDVELLVVGEARHRRVRHPERVDEARPLAQEPQAVRVLGGVQVAHQHDGHVTEERAQMRVDARGLAGAAVQMRRADLDRAPGRADLGAEQHAAIEGVTLREQPGRRVRDRIAAHDRWTFVERQHHRAQKAEQAAAEEARGRAGVDALEAERRADSFGDVAPPPSARRFLEPDHVGVEAAEPIGRRVETVLQPFAVAPQTGGHAAVEDVEADEAKRSCGGRRVRSRAGCERALDDRQHHDRREERIHDPGMYTSSCGRVDADRVYGARANALTRRKGIGEHLAIGAAADARAESRTDVMRATARELGASRLAPTL